MQVYVYTCVYVYVWVGVHVCACGCECRCVYVCDYKGHSLELLYSGFLGKKTVIKYQVYTTICCPNILCLLIPTGQSTPYVFHYSPQCDYKCINQVITLASSASNSGTMK